VEARKGTAHLALPSSTTDMLEAARDCFERAKPALQQQGSPEELAELEMNIGLVLQTLAGVRRAKITDAIAAYQRALRTFDRLHPKGSRSSGPPRHGLSIPMMDRRQDAYMAIRPSRMGCV
jgi:hypothetical protein